MRIAITGAGTVGASLAARLAATEFTTEIHWVNRDFPRVQAGAVDIEHGLAFSRACRRVQAYALQDLSLALSRVDALVLTHGVPVPPGETRDHVYGRNRDLLVDSVMSHLSSFEGIVLVVTNPVDLLARLVHVVACIPARRVVGLGTVVETARLKWSLAGYLTPSRSPTDVQTYAIGTHDEEFVAIVPTPVAAGARGFADRRDSILSAVRAEVAGAARRVKALRQAAGPGGPGPIRGTMHPIVEGAVSVLDAIALDRGTTHTVSVLDPDDPDRLFYSMPCILDRGGVRTRLTGDLQRPDVAKAMESCVDTLRDRLHRAGGP